MRTCKEFLKYNVDQRYDLVVVKKYCQNCLARSHTHQECRSDQICRVCKRRHNTLLHGAQQLTSSTASSSRSHARIDPNNSKRLNTTRDSAAIHQPFFNWNRVFVPTASVKITTDRPDTWISTRVIIAPSLTVSRISKSFVRKYKIKTISKYAHDFATFNIRSYNENNNWSIKVTALLTETLPRKPYTVPISEDPTEDFPENSLADLDPQSNTIVEIELGSDVFPMIRRDGVIHTEVGRVIAQKSALGYLFSGPVDELW